jgi:hypothetical protein
MKMNRLNLVCTLVGLAAIAGAETSASNPYSVSLGWNYLLDKTSADATHSSGYQGVLGYHFTNLGSLVGQADTSLELSWARNSGSGNKLDLFGLQAVARYPLSTGRAKSSRAPYYGFGVGASEDQFVYGHHTAPSDSSTLSRGINASSGVHSDSKVNFAGKVLLGLNFTKSAFVEAAYNYNGSVEGTTLTSLSLSAGWRF